MTWIVEVNRTHEGWNVDILQDSARHPARHPTTGALLLPVTRRLGALTTGSRRFPLPPADDRDAVDVALLAACPKLADLAADDVQRREVAREKAISSLYRKVLNQSIAKSEMSAFGAYLFHTLLGKTLWDALIAAEPDRVELMLSWQPLDRDLTRLPWEMLDDGDGFLAARKRFALSRQVTGAATAVLRPLSAPPRVLFVIGGADGNNRFDGLKPGAEYLGILRAMRCGAIGLKHVPLIGASPRRLAAMMHSLRPDVVHFICHGLPDGTLEMLDDDKADATRWVGADQLFELLHPESPVDPGYAGPQVVVLSACHTASDEAPLHPLDGAGQTAFPLAVELVRKGVPMVLGMAGEVADTACRLFGRSFYESLLTDGRVGRAAARGRRAGLLHGDGGQGLDWALPTLFVSSALSEPVLDILNDASEAHWQALANELGQRDFPPYCLRLGAARQFELLMADVEVQRRMEGRNVDLQVLGLSTTQPPGLASDKDKLGRTAMLRDLASKAARHGHVPLLIDRNVDLDSEWPTDIRQLVSLILRSAAATFQNLGPPANMRFPAWNETLAALGLATGQRPSPTQHADVCSIYQVGTESERLDMIAMALQIDMLAYLDVVRHHFGRPLAKILLLVDDVHCMGDAAAFLVKRLFGSFGLRAQAARRDDLRVVFSFSRESGRPERASAVQAIIDFLSQKRYAEEIGLSVFRAGLESRLAYESVLFEWQQDNAPVSLVPLKSKEGALMVDFMFQQLQSTIGGIPSRFKSQEAKRLVELLIQLPAGSKAVRVANDEDAMSKTE